MVSLFVTTLLACLMMGPIGALTAVAAVAFKARQLPLGVALGVLDLALCVGWLWWALSGRGGAMVRRVSARFYAADGEAVPLAQTSRIPRGTKVFPWLFCVLVPLTPVVGQELHVSLRLLLPLEALYVVPFGVYAWFLQGGRSAPMMLLAPGLYAVHAILVAAGVPLLTNLPTTLAVLAPFPAYQVVAVIASHLYGRWALRRLRALAQAAGAEGQEGEA
jgi:hypothetical protein